MKVVDVPDGGDGRRRVGVREVKGEMTCVIQAKYRDPVKNAEAVVMHVEYKGTCKGIWFPGVATLLGLDVGLEAKNSDVSWVPGASPTWEVEGSPGYSGFDIGRGLLLSPDSRASSFRLHHYFGLRYQIRTSGNAPLTVQLVKMLRPNGRLLHHPLYRRRQMLQDHQERQSLSTSI